MTCPWCHPAAYRNRASRLVARWWFSVAHWENHQPAPTRGAALTNQEVNTLATYNAERARGLVHTADWRRRMAELQARFDADAEAWAARWATGWTDEKR